MKLLGHDPKVDSWVEPGWHRKSSCCMHTLTRIRPRTSIPRFAAGCDRLSPLEYCCWEKIGFGTAPFQVELRYHLYSDSDGQCSRLLCANEAERLHWVDVYYSVYARKEGSTAQFELERYNLLANAWHIGVVCALSHQAFLSLDAVSTPFDWKVISNLKVLEIPGTIEPFTNRVGSVSAEEKQIVLSFIRSSEKGQTDVRLDVGTPFRPKCWPRGSINTRLWRWRVATSWQWTSKEHINVLEARASLNCLRRRCRNATTLSKRFLLLSDSQVCTAILSKGKTSSRRMLPVIKKFNSLTLASRSMVYIAFCSSEDNPSDIPSRWRLSARLRMPKHSVPKRGNGLDL